MSEWFLGTMGFGYKDWGGGVFYPVGLPSANFLAYYSRSFNAVELDTTFYGVPTLAKVKQWANSVPDRFVFCAKLPRTLTHDNGLRKVQGELDEFVEVMRHLGEKLGVILIQLPPGFTLAEEKYLVEFLKYLPTDIRFAVEFRHPSWLVPKIEDMLNRNQVSWATTEYPGLPNQVKQTSDFLYIRWIGQHGTYDRHTYERVDKTSQLVWWNEQLQPHLDRADRVYGFFNNDYAGYAIGTCNKYKKILGLPVSSDQVTQGRLF
jgi:uncharacterized protein YecE (DUF72 family)